MSRIPKMPFVKMILEEWMHSLYLLLWEFIKSP